MVCLVPDSEVVIIKIQITMKKEQNLQEPQEQALNIPVVSGSVLVEGYSEGEICNRNGCNGIIKEHEKEGRCSCHINPPCSYCTELNAYCETCGWDAKEEQDEYDKQQMEVYKKNESYYAQQRKEFDEARDLFYKKYRGEIPAEKLEMRGEPHTHFTMKKIGVFPKGSETYESLLPKVRGTFGGRFTTVIDKDSYRFEYIAYTD